MSFLKKLFGVFKKDKDTLQEELIHKNQKQETKKVEKVEIKMEKKQLFTLDQLYLMNDKWYKDACGYYLNAFNEVLPQYNIDTPLRICHFLAQIIHESGYLKAKVENLNYSSQALSRVFSKYFPSNSIAEEYERQPEKIANRIYANRMGNGDEDSGDGWKYRGRGLIQLTGKNNYKSCSNDLGLDLVNNPDLIINDPEVNVKTACWFWKKNNLNSLADKDDITSITKKINGGINGLTDRKNKLDICKKVLGLIS